MSNLSFVVKLSEKVVASQFVDHLSRHELHDCMRSAYRANFSTETALIKLKNDVLLAFDSHRSVSVVFLDLTAAFDTVDNDGPLRLLESRCRLSGVALQWMRSCLIEWSSRVSIKGSFSDSWDLKFGVLQGSVLGPILFNVYISPVSDIIKKHGLSYIVYADDIQLYTTYDIRSPEDISAALSRISSCIVEVSAWMSDSYLKLNNAKTEFIAFDRSSSFTHLANINLVLDDQVIPLSRSVINLGVSLDSSFKLSSHVQKIVRTCNFHLKNLWRIRRFIDMKTCHHAVLALIISRLDYCNSLFSILSARDRKRLESIQNRAARLVFSTGRRSHALPLLKELHWLPLTLRVNFKICLIVFKILNNCAPEYLIDMLTPYKPARYLRSLQDYTRLIVPRYQLSSSRSRFGIYAPTVWNELPQSLRVASSISSFKAQLKTYLFSKI